MSEHNPDVWVVVEFSGTKVKGKDSRYHRVLAGWYGGFAGSNSWQMNSGITKIIDKGDYYEIHGDSGSIYNCGKSIERFSGLTQSIYQGYVAQNTDEIAINQVDISTILNLYNDTTT